jgi:16S rRNA (adenine1518-N6/adenine1519-N6)-dimethyltransferase
MGAYFRLVKPNEPAAKKRFGQHFLRDTGVIDRIVRWIQPRSEDVFLEIGAGDGALSLRLAPAVASLIAVEIDNECIPRLRSVLEAFPSAKVVAADILHLNLAEFGRDYLQAGQRLRIAGNLPYNIATPIIEIFLIARLPIEDMYFMVQYEVAQRITASPGSRRYGFFSVYCQHYSDVQMGFKVSPACFVPRPGVSSAMISLRPKSLQYDPVFESDFEAVTKAAFGHRRKTIANSLSRHPLFESIAEDLLNRAGISGSKRAEEISVQEYEVLARIYGDLRLTTEG